MARVIKRFDHSANLEPRLSTVAEASKESIRKSFVGKAYGINERDRRANAPRITLTSGNGPDLAFKNKQLSSARSFGFEIGPKSGRIASLEASNGKCPFQAISAVSFRSERHLW